MLYLANRNGIPCIESTGVTLDAESATFSFKAHPQVNAFFQGAIFVKINDTFTAPTPAVPIRFSTTGIANSTKTLKGYNGEDVTTANFAGTGIYIVFYDRATDTLQLLTSIV